ncbi:hypothetical protein GV794_09840 [Nocardia cyriacigeorgica]|uniref:Uncharacterized protein n=1 Tax=Nocardia cyriacigeorgica TaxID=135487 RepID=A0A6P1DFC9_9NOCA|nr:hypothetical protein [Nocardia cyriacigeorgica]NEW42174.1 hypothetical protein [Nocardia cyriacigeorgica]NEW47132.1 hypothetical protein [Nocardia cyriacigeorgica]NEW53192.1 hypothetical protein [Nocardia cyriacigeorgica]NEW55951.1 hypothetical protein [Nocardia cyriacigeorgica]
MIPSTPDPVPAANPADLAEQSVLVEPEDDTPDGAELHTRDNWNADPADLLEQSISVPMDDEYDEETEPPA